jgi:biopolymer transport protein TolQ
LALKEGTYLLALYAQLLLLPDPVNRSLWNDIASMTFFSKAILVILLFLSVVSWATMIYKYLRTRKVNAETNRFLREFRRRRSLDDYYSEAGKYPLAPFAGMLHSAYEEIRGLAGQSKFKSVPGGKVELNDGQLDMVADAIDRAGAEEVARLDTGIIFLATTANASPFLGLLGTVVGIYVAFKDIGSKGTATLGVVAPAIAEALIATAAGLAAAIPALIGYNYFVSRNRVMADRVDNFKSELFSAFKKEIKSLEEV